MYGLYDSQQLVAVMTFGPNRYGKDGVELLRYCTIADTAVIGGAGKLFKHYFNEFNPSMVTSFADRRWSSQGAFYTKLGFELIGTTRPSYYYIIDNHLENRMAYQKHKLVEAGYDANKTEHEIMIERGIYRIYDCGNYKYVYSSKK
jgi:hypothetical protein